MNPQSAAPLPNPDPLDDSATASVVNQQAPYMVKTYARPPLMFVKGEGVYLYDVENRKYLDFTAGIAVNALGHCDPEMSRIIAQQVCYVSSRHGELSDGMQGTNTRPHLESIPQSMDRRIIRTSSNQDIGISINARCSSRIHLQFR